jgi:1,4-alpha-glucan branching enzyme
MTERPDDKGFTKSRISSKETPASTVPPENQKISILSDFDIYLFNEGRNFRLYNHLGAHPVGDDKTRFAVWAPAAHKVSVLHNKNGWRSGIDILEPQGNSGIFIGVISDITAGDCYKYKIESGFGITEKADPFAFATELPPKTASVVTSLAFEWSDQDWMTKRQSHQDLGQPISVYELHLGSFLKHFDGSFASYEELAERIAEHVGGLGFTHVELLPVMEHPFSGSWGYQTTGYFAPTSRHGTPDEFMKFVDRLHRAGIGVILDFVPSHFATDEFALANFDGTHLYEHADPNRGIHPDWGSYEFNYGRHEVRSFLISAACFWLDKYHIDGLRVDAVASMLYLDYSRENNQWQPNVFGGREDLDAINFLKQMNEEISASFPGVITVAEESTAWPGVTAPTSFGGLGFTLKWDMGWMHDTLRYLSREPVHRKYHYNELTFRSLYAYSERYVLPLSHDEVVHGKKSLVSKMPGDDWQRRANLRLLIGYQYLLPGKKLLFMGAELAEWQEWNHERELEWGLLNNRGHSTTAAFMATVNKCYRTHEALFGHDTDTEGFEWLIANADEDSVLAWIRWGRSGEFAICVANYTPVPRYWSIGVPLQDTYVEILNSDDMAYGGSGILNQGEIPSEDNPMHGKPARISIQIPPLGVAVFYPSQFLSTK